MRRARLLRLDLPQAFLLALLLHLLFLGAGDLFPGLAAPWKATIPVPAEPEPLRFTFVDLPRERPEPETPPERAPASDRTRRAASPETPPEVDETSRDPFSRGNTSQEMGFVPGQPAAGAPAAPLQPERTAPEDVPEEEPSEDGLGEARAEAAPDPEQERKRAALRELTRPGPVGEYEQRYDTPEMSGPVDMGPISFDTVGVDWGPYAKLLVERIRREWLDRIPPAAYVGVQGRSVVQFRILPDGTIHGVELVSASGVRPFDLAAGYAVEAASPAPPLPPEFRALGKDDVGVTFEFYYNMTPPRR